MEPLTTYRQAARILQELKGTGISNIKLKYTGWFNKGVDHRVPTRVNLERKLGGKRGLRLFAEILNDNDLEFYPDVAFLNVYKNNPGFSSLKDAVRYIYKEVALIYPYGPALPMWHFGKDYHFLLSPLRLPEYVDRFLQQLGKIFLERHFSQGYGE